MSKLLLLLLLAYVSLLLLAGQSVHCNAVAPDVWTAMETLWNVSARERNKRVCGLQHACNQQLSSKAWKAAVPIGAGKLHQQVDCGQFCSMHVLAPGS